MRLEVKSYMIIKSALWIVNLILYKEKNPFKEINLKGFL